MDDPLLLGLGSGSSSTDASYMNDLMVDYQVEHYTALVDLYALVPRQRDSGGSADDANEYALALTDVPCRRQTTRFRTEEKMPVGRSQADNFLTLDNYHFVAGTEILDTMIAQVKTPGDPQYGQTYKCQGFGQIRSGPEGNYTHALFRLQMPWPKGVPHLTTEDDPGV